MMKLLNLGKVCGLFLFALFFSFPVLAETKQATVYTKFSDQDIVDILKTQYDNIKIRKKGEIQIIEGGIGFAIKNRGEGGLEFIALASDPDKYSLSDLNKWHGEKRFLRAYFYEDNDIILQADLDVEGITREYLLRYVGTFIAGVWQFQQQ